MHRASRGIVALSGFAAVLLARAQPARTPSGAAGLSALDDPAPAGSDALVVFALP
jgi:hypothetical protein